MNLGFVKVAAATPMIKVADCSYNANQIISEVKKAVEKNVELLCFPELSITAYTCSDLFFQKTLQDSALKALEKIIKETKNLEIVFCVGLPIMNVAKLYNCAAIIFKGKILGLVPKTYIPNYSEFYEKRHFAPAPQKNIEINILGQKVIMGTKQIFACENFSEFTFAVEICEDLWSPIPPSAKQALNGANIILNLSASDEIIGKENYRRQLVSSQSASLLCGYVYCDAGDGESTTDMVFSGHNIIAENGSILKQTKMFENKMIISDIDVERLVSERAKNTSFHLLDEDYVVNYFSIKENKCLLDREYFKYPFVPADSKDREERCELILTMQAKGLEKRLSHTNCKKSVIGISGGLDSCLALLVTVRAFDFLNIDRKNIIAVTMPCFGTTDRTKNNATKLCEELGVTLLYKNITDTVRSNFSDIDHNEEEHSVTYENVQARVRTLLLMNLANKENGLVIGTGDLSELALGWATYNGDHMSMYGVNASIPKTLVRHLVAHYASSSKKGLKETLEDILATPVSPELLPAKDGLISQQTEDIVGPYDLHDFFIYYLVRCSFSPKKIFTLAKHSFKEEFSEDIIYKWLRIFCCRFFSQQFKRSCLPDSPKVGTITFSPRADWRMPSDACVTEWIRELEEAYQNN
ncbi:MAG: NAD(+) synthase [Clostridia bacterium]